MLPVSAVAKQQSAVAKEFEPDIDGHWSGTFRSNRFNKAPFTLDMDIDKKQEKDNKRHGRWSNSGPTYCLGGDVNFDVDRQGSQVTIAGTNAKGNTITIVGTIDPTGSLMTVNYHTNGSLSGDCESDDGAASLKKK
jgi:hypothetical protein